MKCDTPARSLRSSREPAPIQKPIDTERTLGTFSEITRSPESSSDRTYFCTGRSYRGRIRCKFFAAPASQDMSVWPLRQPTCRVPCRPDGKAGFTRSGERDLFAGDEEPRK